MTGEDSVVTDPARYAETASTVPAEMTFRAEQIAGWQSETSALIDECLAEIRMVSVLLGSVGTTDATSHTEHTPRRTVNPEESDLADSPKPFCDNSRRPGQPTGTTGDQSATERPPETPSDEENDFDARLANLKKLLAEKLTDS